MKFKVGDIVERRGTKIYKSDKKGLITLVEYRHGDPFCGVVWMGADPPRILWYEPNDLKMYQQA